MTSQKLHVIKYLNEHLIINKTILQIKEKKVLLKICYLWKENNDLKTIKELFSILILNIRFIQIINEKLFIFILNIKVVYS